MRKLNLVIVALVMLVIAGCAKKADVEAERAALRAADAEWSRGAGNAESFVSFFAPDGVIYPPNEPAVAGVDNLRSWATKMMAMPGFSVSWEATSADVAASGDLGYTVGTYMLHMQGPGGESINDNGKYVSVWKKDTAGAWKVVADMFNSDLPPASPAAPADTTATPTQ